MKSKLCVGLAISLFALPASAADEAAVVSTYADIAGAKYADSLTSAKTLQGAVKALISNPSADALSSAKDAWFTSRVPYQQTEVYRFGNAIVDDWEGKVNAWPLDERLIGYVDSSYRGPTEENKFAALNVVANAKFMLSGKEIDATNITPQRLEEVLHEADGVEANVATGYHAVEFLLWGQDLNGHGSGAGSRSWTDYAKGDACTYSNFDRRADYLKAATDLLVSDLEWMAAQWVDGGAARAAVEGNTKAGLVAKLTGMGSISYGETAGERMRLDLMLNDPEDEHYCFADNTDPADDGLEIDHTGFDLVAFYARNLAVPARREVNDPKVLLGKHIFYETGCVACHTPKFVTHRLKDRPKQSFQLIWPYSNLLLHGMGEGLADNRPEARATGREWRTPPLWGIGLTERVAVTPTFCTMAVRGRYSKPSSGVAAKPKHSEMLSSRCRRHSVMHWSVFWRVCDAALSQMSDRRNRSDLFDRKPRRDQRPDPEGSYPAGLCRA